MFSRIAHGGLGTEVSLFLGRLCSQLLEATRVPRHTRLFLCLLSHSVVSDSLQPHGLYPAGLFCPLNFPGKNTGVDCHFLLQGNLPDPGVKPASPTSPVSTGRFFTTVPPGKWQISVQLSHSDVSDSLQPHESQQARPPCLSPTPGVYSNSCPSSR